MLIKILNNIKRTCGATQQLCEVNTARVDWIGVFLFLSHIYIYIVFDIGFFWDKVFNVARMNY